MRLEFRSDSTISVRVETWGPIVVIGGDTLCIECPPERTEAIRQKLRAQGLVDVTDSWGALRDLVLEAEA